MIIITILEAIFFLLLFLIGLFCVLYAIVKIIQFLTYVPYNQTYEFNPNDLPDENKTIKVFDYNCFWRPWLLHIGTIEHVRERSQLLTERLDDFDILCLNESFHFGSTVVKDFIAVMNKKGFKDSRVWLVIQIYNLGPQIMIRCYVPLKGPKKIPFTKAIVITLKRR